MEIVRTVGSDPSNDIVIDKPGVASFHATLTFSAGNIMVVEDLNSRFGTFVNNRKIRGKKALKAQDILCFADSVFAFEESYPEMLTYKNPEDSSIDLESIHEDAVEVEDQEKEILRDKSGLKRWIYNLQFPKNRQRMQRIWILVISSIMLLTLILPFLSWGNPTEYSFLVNKGSAWYSGGEMFLVLLDINLKGAPMIYILLQVITMLLIMGVGITTVLFILYGSTVWKLKNLRVIRRISQVMLVLFGLNFLFQFLRFVIYWYDGANTSVQGMLFSNSPLKSLIFTENLGIGFWMCAIGFILILRSTRNGLWRPDFGRKWATLSFSFWLPFVVMIALVHQGLGVVQTTVDVERYEDEFGLDRAIGFNDDIIIRSRVCQGAPFVAAQTTVLVIQDWKMAEATKDNYDDVFPDTKKVRLYSRLLVVASYCLFLVLIVMMLRKKIRGRVQFILSAAVLLFSVLLFISLHQLLAMSPGYGGDIIRRTEGIGAFAAILGGLGLLGEQFYFYTNRSERGKEEKLIDELE
ncbi:MAG: hypothetical protein Crog4KO_12740 [Crocinitomicaceae bacterium]